jgi:FAD/FMN-containing dehydrogenase
LESFLAELKKLVGEKDWVQDPEELKNWGRDWTRLREPRPLIAVFPRSSAEVSKILSLCSVHRVAVVPSGGRTGLAGGAVAAEGELVLSLARMNHMSPVDLTSQSVRVEAGAVTQAVHEHASAAGLMWPVDLASKGSCMVGGNIATNAGGLRVIRYGHTRNWVQSLKVVLMSGEVLELSGDLEKNNTGYDLKQLIIGSEGTLAVVTEATLRLCARAPEKELFFFGLESMPRVLELLRAARAEAFVLQAFECMTANCLERVVEKRGVAHPFPSRPAFYVLMEIEKPGLTQSSLDAWLGSLFETKLVVDGALASSSQEARRYWSYREGITESLALTGLVYKNDLALPIRELDRFTRELLARGIELYPGCELYLFGHIGDGNLHINVLKPATLEPSAFVALAERANEKLFEWVRSCGGSIAAEHGIGLLKRDFLEFSRSPLEIDIFRSIKQAFDPQGLLNPGKIFRASSNQ